MMIGHAIKTAAMISPDTDIRIDAIRERIEPLRNELLQHPVYSTIDSVERLRVFMQHHVFAVWDFMSLLKTLQRAFAPSDVPWTPPASRLAARLVNEIVLAEESDEDDSGDFASHFDLYYQAMTQSGADTGPVDRFLNSLRVGNTVSSSLQAAGVADSIAEFVMQTFEQIGHGDLCAIAAAFNFGREDLLPDVFQEVVSNLAVDSTNGLDEFKYYLARHIELDGDEHGPMALQLISLLCGDDPVKWQAAESAAVASLQARKGLWDGMLV